MDTVTAHVVLLDGFGLHHCRARPGATVVDLPRGVQRLVAYLGLSHRPPRTAVAGQLWPDASEAHAHSSLRSAVWRLQKAVPGMVDLSCGALALARGVRVDVRELTQWAHGVLNPRADVDGVMPLDVGQEGELLPGWYDDWVLLERERLRQLRMHTLEALADKLGRAGRYAEAVQAAHAAVRAEPLRETAHRVLVRIHLAEGNVADAVRTYESFRKVLLDEMGVAPTAQMNALVSGFRPPAGSRPVRALVPLTTGSPPDGEPYRPARASDV
jgi:DNA-binding SARP family transcriptional activator